MMKNLFLFAGLLFCFFTRAQDTPPEVSRFLQVNTYNGGQLSHLISDQNNNAFMTGVTNGKNFSFDGYNIMPVGIDDMFVIKTNETGQNQWLKTVNAGSKGIIKPNKSYLNSNGELYVTGSFTGTITFASNTITSTALGNFIMKFGSDGSEKWIFETSLLVNDLTALTSTEEIFAVSNYDIYRINDNSGLIKNTKSFASEQFKMNAIIASPIQGYVYVAGVPRLSGSVDGIAVEQNVGAILRGNFAFTFSESMQFPVSDFYPNSEVFDLQFLSDASIAVVGLSSGATTLKNNAGTIYQATNSSDYNGNGYYTFVAKINPGFSDAAWFRTSSKVGNVRFSSTNNYLDVLEIFNFDIFPNVSTNFRVLLKLKNTISVTYTLPSGYVNTDNGKVVLFNCEYLSGLHNSNIDIWSDYSQNGYLAYNGNGVQRYDKTSLFSVAGSPNSQLYYRKNKTETDFGSLSSNYIKHTGTDGSLISYAYQCGKTNYFGSEINNFITPPSLGVVCSDIISKIAPNGNVVWKSQLIGTTQYESNPSWNANVADTNASGENVLVSQFLNNVQFVDNNNVTTDFTRQNMTVSNYANLITVTDADGTLKWAKKLEPATEGQRIRYTSVAYDNNGNVILAGTTDDTFLIDDIAYNFNKNKILFLMKLDATTGNILFAKQFTDMDAYMINLDTDNENNIYLSFEPIPAQIVTSYSFGSVSVALGDVNHLFLKFDSNGNTILGKNYYADNASGDYNYSWPNSFKFDGTDFIISGEMYSTNKMTYKGIDGQIITNPYTAYNLSGYIAKVDKSGNVIWHKPIFANNRIIQNKADIDELGNVYYYFGVLDKINIDGTETTFDASNRSAALLKISANDGTLKYLKNLGIHKNYLYNGSLSVLQNNILSFSGNLTNQDEYLYNINDYNASNYYIATLGKLPTPYLTPENNYLLVTNIEVPNNITDNTGDFDLITNVDWSVASNQEWLALSFEKLALRTEGANIISGSGDHKITLTAAQNLTGITRTAIITISGNGVANKEIEVTQSGSLGITEIKERNVSFYPNPFDDKLFLTSNNQNIKEVNIYDSLGRLVKTISKINSMNFRLDAGNMTTGNYFIVIKTENGTESFKVIKR